MRMNISSVATAIESKSLRFNKKVIIAHKVKNKIAPYLTILTLFCKEYILIKIKEKKINSTGVYIRLFMR